MSNAERKRLENQEQLDEYNARQEKYDDMIRDELQRQKFLSRMHNIRKITYTKKMVAVILGISIFDIQLSYVLAFFGKSEIVSGLSNQLCTTILGVSFVYMIRAYFDSRAEHKNINQQIKNELTEQLSGKIDDVFKAAGINVHVQDFLNDSDEDSFGEKSSAGFHFNISGGRGENEES